MEKRGYSKYLSSGALASGGTLGILIPPSIPLILYGMVTGESVGKLFMAGVIPGIISVCLLSAFIIVRCLLFKDVPRDRAATWRERFTATKKGIWGLLSVVIIIGGIYTGLFTPTEAAAVGLVYAVAVCFIGRTMNLKDLGEAFLGGIKTTSMVLMIVVGAMIFGQAITLIKLPQQISEFLISLNLLKWQILIAFNILFFIMGMFLDPSSVILITVPIVYPILIAMGIDPIYFAIIMTINMELACITPPVGLNLYVVKGIMPHLTTIDVIRGVIPFVVIELCLLAMVMIFPDLTLFLPSQMK
jgi:C4-dicarboxylate transporter DctM subunit